jgi:hypothetical protein
LKLAQKLSQKNIEKKNEDKHFGLFGKLRSCEKSYLSVQMEDIEMSAPKGAMDEIILDEVSYVAGRKVWLVKVPNFLAEAWSKQEPNENLGTLTLKEGGNGIIDVILYFC